MNKRNLLALVLVVCSSYIVSAQGPPPPPPPPGLPIDSGIIFLVIAGLFYGTRKIKN